MWELEYALLFGIPNNKLELIDGRTRCAFPFLSREVGEAHLQSWLETLCRWKGVAELPPIRKGRKRWKARVGRFALELFPRPMDLRIPLNGKVYETFFEAAWRRDFWEGQPPGKETGWDHFLGHQDVQINLWSLFGEFCSRHGGQHSGRVDIALSDRAAVAPDQYYFAKSREECTIHGDYFKGVPDLIAEVLSPPSRALDRVGPRMDLYRRVGVPHLWLLDPEIDTFEVYELTDKKYRLAAVYRPGDEFCPALFPDVKVNVTRLFLTQLKRAEARGHWQLPPYPILRIGPRKPQAEPPTPIPASEAEPMPEWLVSPQTKLGLEYLFLLGHPERRWEIWGDRVPCVLPFGSASEARLRFGHFLEEMAAWEQAPPPKPAAVADDVDQAEVGRFRLTRRGRQVHLDIAVDARKYRKLLEVWTRRDVWDWGEKKK